MATCCPSTSAPSSTAGTATRRSASSSAQVAPEVAELSRVTEASLWAGLAAARAGAHLTDISHAVETTIVGAGPQYGIVEEYGGHGIGSRMHMDPHILNYGSPGRGPILRPGMALAIEPMVTLGSPEVGVLADAWTVVTLDGSCAAHWEHSVAITEDGPWVLTALDDVRLCRPSSRNPGPIGVNGHRRAPISRIRDKRMGAGPGFCASPSDP